MFTSQDLLFSPHSPLPICNIKFCCPIFISNRTNIPKIFQGSKRTVFVFILIQIIQSPTHIEHTISFLPFQTPFTLLQLNLVRAKSTFKTHKPIPPFLNLKQSMEIRTSIYITHYQQQGLQNFKHHQQQLTTKPKGAEIR